MRGESGRYNHDVFGQDEAREPERRTIRLQYFRRCDTLIYDNFVGQRQTTALRKKVPTVCGCAGEPSCVGVSSFGCRLVILLPVSSLASLSEPLSGWCPPLVPSSFLLVASCY